MNDRSRSIPKPAGRLWQGAAILGLAAVISKVLGTIQKIPLQNLAGDAVFGIYNAVYPLYTFLLVLATAGIPIAVSKFVSEAVAEGRPLEARRLLKLTNALMAGTGLLGFGLLYGGAETIAGWIGGADTAPAIRSISFALLVMPVTAGLRGYFQGLHDMVPTAVSQVAEQVVRVGVMLTLLLVLVGRGASDATIAAGATFGSTAGAGAALLAALGFWRAHRARHVAAGRALAAEAPGDGARKREPEPTAALLRRFVAYALPVCLGAVVLPLLTLVDTFTMPRLLQHGGGLDEAAAMAAFGLYNHGLPLVQLVSMIVTSMSVALIPALTAARQCGDNTAIRRMAGVFLRFGWLVGLAASVGLAVLARPLDLMLYGASEGAGVMAILGATAAFAVVQIVAGTLLQGLGAERAPAYYLLAAAGVKIGLNLLLMPRWGIHGAAVAAVAAYATAAALSCLRLRRLLGPAALERPARPPAAAAARAAEPAGVSAAGAVARPVLAAAIMAAGLALWLAAAALALHALPVAPPERAAQTVVALSAVAGGGLLYAAALFRVRAISAAELAALPEVGPKLARLAARLRLIPIEERKRSR
ncbi:oligosaccharide flippase family protein [Paenibacillus sp. HJGM_3]|uniref:putative polysaccharide biosynthesis protein n=1 Tax=Paenibacillus sp. HJGM_3 TaxID=3379816 RepID=UPI00385A73E0